MALIETVLETETFFHYENSNPVQIASDTNTSKHFNNEKCFIKSVTSLSSSYTNRNKMEYPDKKRHYIPSSITTSSSSFKTPTNIYIDTEDDYIYYDISDISVFDLDDSTYV
jgi:hypothetical protein